MGRVIQRLYWQDFGLFDYLPNPTLTFLVLKIDKNWQFVEHLPTLSCQRSLEWPRDSNDPFKKIKHLSLNFVVLEFAKCEDWVYNWRIFMEKNLSKKTSLFIIGHFLGTGFVL